MLKRILATASFTKKEEIMENFFAEIVGRFEKYICFNTQSNEENTACPSTEGQMVFAKFLAKELKDIGLSEVSLDKNGYIMATLPSNIEEETPVVGFISHMDTSPDMAGGPINPKIIENYDGKDIVLNIQENIVLTTKDFPEVVKYKGQEVMVTDGLTLLGADDKAGIAAIVTAMKYLVENPEIKRGKVRLGFTPDEEIGRGADLFDVKKFGADFAYTIDGDELGSLEYENFNAAGATLVIKGKNVHPGSAKAKMVNAISLASLWQEALPKKETPETTEGYEGFYHVHSIKGEVEKVTIKMLIRDHDKNKFSLRKKFLGDLVESFNKKYGPGTFTLTITDSYYNMKEKLEDKMYLIDLAKKAMKEEGIVANCKPIRGGTDGARLSFEGLACPNIFSGGLNFHGKYELLPLRSMEKAAKVIINIVKNVRSI